MSNTASFSQRNTRFSSFHDGKSIQKSAVMGRKLWQKFLHRDYDFGGFLVEVNGIMGSGKTSLMLGMADKILKLHPKETVFWREPVANPMQITKIGDPSKFQFLCDRRHPVVLYEVTDKGLVKSNDLNIRFFSGIKQLIDKSKPGMVNVVYFADLSKWADLLMRLRFNAGWQTVFIDEAEDVVPQRCSNKNGHQWDKNEMLAANAKQIRKNQVSLVYNSQTGSSDVDSRFRSKSMMFFYLYGSKYDERSPLSKGAIRSLKVGSAWIDYGHSLFGRIQFKPYVPKGPKYMVLPEGEVV